MRFLTLLIITTLFISCNPSTQELTPAITFKDGITDLKEKENNTLWNENIQPGNPDSMRRKLEMKDYTYLTRSKDTLKYMFIRGKLFSAIIKTSHKDYKAELTRISENKKYQKVQDNIFIDQETKIALRLKKEGNLTTYLYMNDANKEITDLVASGIFSDKKAHMEDADNEQFMVQCMLCWMGEASVYSDYFKEKFKNKYYLPLLKF